MGIFARLREMGIPSSVLYMRHFISGVIFQRLVPLLCSACAVPLVLANAKGLVPKSTYARLKKLSAKHFKHIRIRGLGCTHCAHTGIVGRTVCAEVLVPDEIFLSHMRLNQEDKARAYWSTQAHLNLKGLGVGIVSHALLKMHQGLIDPMDVERWIGPLILDEPGAPL
jgi:general secretion pathway protein E